MTWNIVSRFFSQNPTVLSSLPALGNKLSTLAVTKEKTIGVLGITIPGAVDCLRYIQKKISETYTGHANPKVAYYQGNFELIHQAQLDDNWALVAERIVQDSEQLIKAGADFIIIPANTVHFKIKEIQAAVKVPVLNMLEIVAEECLVKGHKKIGILGTKYTMQKHLYKEYLESLDLEEVVPNAADQEIIHGAIFEELILTGTVCEKTQIDLLRVVNNLKEQEECDALALACTELPLVLNELNCRMPVVNTTQVLAQHAVSYASLGLNSICEPDLVLRARL